MNNEEILNAVNRSTDTDPGYVSGAAFALNDIILHLAYVKANEFLKRTGIVARYKRNVIHTSTGYSTKNHVNLVKEIELAVFNHAFRDFAPDVVKFARNGSTSLIFFDAIGVYKVMHPAPNPDIASGAGLDFPYYLTANVFAVAENALNRVTTYYGNTPFPVRVVSPNLNNFFTNRHPLSCSYPKFSISTSFLDLYPRTVGTSPSCAINVSDLYNAFSIIADTFLAAYPRLRKTEAVVTQAQVADEIIENPIPTATPIEEPQAELTENQ